MARMNIGMVFRICGDIRGGTLGGVVSGPLREGNGRWRVSGFGVFLWKSGRTVVMRGLAGAQAVSRHLWVGE